MATTVQLIRDCHMCVRSAPHTHAHSDDLWACHIPYDGCLVTNCNKPHDKDFPDLPKLKKKEH